jgi:hypothetical protein
MPVKRNGTFGDQKPPGQEGGVAEWVGATGRGRKVNKISSIFIGLNGGSVLSLAINHRFLWK